MCVGHTLGEEVLFGQPSQESQQVLRTESVLANDSACVLQLNVKTFQLMKQQRHVGAGGGNLSKDYSVLMYILESHFVQKNQWRVAAGALKEGKRNQSSSQTMPPAWPQDSHGRKNEVRRRL